MKVFILKQEFDCEGFHIVGVFSKESKANYIAEIQNKKMSKKESRLVNWSVEEYDVDD